MGAVGERLPVPLAVYIVSEVARALQYAHSFRKLGIVHRVRTTHIEPTGQ